MSLKNDLNDVLHNISEGQKGEKVTDLFNKGKKVDGFI
jgi:hypothetical protein